MGDLADRLEWALQHPLTAAAGETVGGRQSTHAERDGRLLLVVLAVDR